MNEPKPHDRDTNKVKKKAEPSSGMLEWMAGKSVKGSRSKSKRSPDVALADNADHLRTERDRMLNSPASSTAEKKKRLALLRQDPLNVHQKILKHLQSSTRRPITSIYDVASLVVHSCIDVFDQYQVEEEFQFFDFFERSIGVVVSRFIYFSSPTVVSYSITHTHSQIDKEARCFRTFSYDLARAEKGLNPVNTESDTLFSITEETRLLVEIQDIRDELGILQMILSDQLKPVKEFEEIVNKFIGPNTRSNKGKAPNIVIESYLSRIEKMEKLAEKTYQSVRILGFRSGSNTNHISSITFSI
jgi:hypothetical protein